MFCCYCACVCCYYKIICYCWPGELIRKVSKNDGAYWLCSWGSSWFVWFRIGLCTIIQTKHTTNRLKKLKLGLTMHCFTVLYFLKELRRVNHACLVDLDVRLMASNRLKMTFSLIATNCRIQSGSIYFKVVLWVSVSLNLVNFTVICWQDLKMSKEMKLD